MMDERGGNRRLSGDDVARLTEQVAGLSEAGLLLPSGLRALALEQPSRRLGTTLDQIADRLDRGEALGAALEAQHHRLPGHLRGLVVSGVRTGRLSQVLGRYIGYTTLSTGLRRGLWLSLAYPLIAWFVALWVFGFLFAFIGPQFTHIFRDFGISLPLMTLVVVRISDLATHYGWALVDLFALVVVVAVLSYLFLSAGVRNSMLGAVPVLGRVWRYIALAEFCHLLSVLLESAIPLDSALRLTGEGVNDARTARACRVLADDVEAGQSLTDALDRRPFFPAGLTRILSWAEKTRSLPEALTMAAELFEARAKAQAVVTSMSFAVVTVILIFLGVAFTVVALFLPLITLISKLSG